ncbi:MAG: hypothetical protein FWF33_03955 [Clostridiales bacterium]|nr:hypothetical protein [Clostridiales bacterium]
MPSFTENWFSGVSKEERERRQREMAARVYPLGEAVQRPLVENLLTELFGDIKRFDLRECVFGYIAGKNMYIQQGRGGDGAAKAAAHLKKIGWRDPKRLGLLLAMIELDDAATSPEAYPTAGQVRERAGV